MARVFVRAIGESIKAHVRFEHALATPSELDAGIEAWLYKHVTALIRHHGIPSSRLCWNMDMNKARTTLVTLRLSLPPTACADTLEYDLDARWLLCMRNAHTDPCMVLIRLR